MSSTIGVFNIIEKEKKERPSFDEIWLDVARVISQRATCPRASCGAVLIDCKRNTIISTGYNGASRGEEHCTEVGCDIEDGHCQRAIHAEINAITQAAMHGSSVDGSMMYIYKKNYHIDSSQRGIGPCRECLKVMKAANILGYRVVGGE